jgi:hypothetical protein
MADPYSIVFRSGEAKVTFIFTGPVVGGRAQAIGIAGKQENIQDADAQRKFLFPRKSYNTKRDALFSVREMMASLKWTETPERITDGLGNYWPAICSLCGEKSVKAVSQGKAKCVNCG